MGRIADRFELLRRQGRKGFIPFVTAGDPDLETSLAILLKLAELGADVIEIGVPFSDPMADGPTIQRSSQRALANGVRLSDVIDLARQVRAQMDVPIVLFSYLNPLLRQGFGEVTKRAADVGVDGVLITDAVDDEAMELSRILRGVGLDLISLIAPTTSDDRLERIANTARGFLYAISRSGVTGATQDLGSEAEKLVERARKFADLPIAVGFGISSREHIVDVWRYADAAVVGSAIVSEIERSEREHAVDVVETFVRSILPRFAKSEAEL